MDDPEVMTKACLLPKQMPQVEWIVHLTEPHAQSVSEGIFLLDRKGISHAIDADWDVWVVYNNHEKPICSVNSLEVVDGINNGEEVCEADKRYGWSIRSMMEQESLDEDMQKLAIIKGILSDRMRGEWVKRCGEEREAAATRTAAASKGVATVAEAPRMKGLLACMQNNLGVGTSDSNAKATGEEPSQAISTGTLELEVPDEPFAPPKAKYRKANLDYLRSYVNGKPWMKKFFPEVPSGARGGWTKKDYITAIEDGIKANERAIETRANDSNPDDQEAPAKKKLRTGKI